MLLFVCVSNFSLAQNNFDIIFPNENREQICQNFTSLFQQKPKEVNFSIQREGNHLYFQVNDKDWFNSIFSNPYDGIALDIIDKNRFDCSLKSIEGKQIKGELLKPVYRQQLRSGLKPNGENLFRVNVGRVPANIADHELEYNILFLSNKNLCRYQIVYNLASYPWDLLEMGMYLDSLAFNTKEIKPTAKEAYKLSNKTLKFIIPFEKNKSEYTSEDIKPIYDSLQLTDFNIKAINIKAYASVEGSLERNLELQNQRANTIVEALQSFQKPTIKTEVSSSENWVEFLNDIKGTEYANLISLTKNEVKAKLVGALSNELEYILKDHRKAVLKLELQKIDRYENLSENELLSKFNTAIENEELDEARKLQNSIFGKIKSNAISPDVLDKMNVPEQINFAKLKNKNSAFKYMQDERQIFIVYNELIKLEKLVPKDGEVKYNITALKIRLWRYKTIEIDDSALKRQIQSLQNYGIPNTLISRMLVNYHIVKAENLMRLRDYKNKDVSVKYIHQNYKHVPLSDYDYLSLAQFFSYYANTDLAVELLENKSRSIDIDEDLLFYYINLSIINKQLTKDADYRTVLLNAINMNKTRFCKLFNPIDAGGVTFQLLEDNYLRNVYCESCVE
jgi:outer membrane protein OmpA-like peptidoglycan-associated protein